ncbi:11594_t:CDS:2, partial [Dentiscutata heterogama]
VLVLGVQSCLGSSILEVNQIPGSNTSLHIDKSCNYTVVDGVFNGPSYSTTSYYAAT